MVGWHHRLNGHEFAQARGDGDGQGSLVCCSLWSHKDSDTAEPLNNNKVGLSAQFQRGIQKRGRCFCKVMLRAHHSLGSPAPWSESSDMALLPGGQYVLSAHVPCRGGGWPESGERLLLPLGEAAWSSQHTSPEMRALRL